MPVATCAALRNQDTANVEAAGFPVLLANTYHLLLRPGPDVFRKLGGIHSFMNWPRSVLTDSGGFQIFSLSQFLKMSEEGAAFKSYIDGRDIMLSPELSIETQLAIGSDIMMALDQCVPSKSDESISANAVEITARWAERSFRARGDSPASLFGIVQGACSAQLRKRSASQITSLPFDGFAVGGLAVGESAEERKAMTELATSMLPQDRPRYLMGVGTPIDLLEGVARGIDMFDCIIPTALGQQGLAYTSMGRIQLRRGVYKYSDSPVDEKCNCVACRKYTRAYLHHLIKADENFGSSLIGLHNLFFYRNLMNSMRAHILAGTFQSFYSEQQDRLQLVDEENPPVPPKRKPRNLNRVLGAYEIIEQNGGFHSIRHKSSGEIMHSVSDPLVEAKALYVDQVRLRPHLVCDKTDDFVIWDVGLGAGTNVMATIFEHQASFQGNTSSRQLSIVSFENDLDSLRLALSHPSLFPHVRHAAPASILKHGVWKSDMPPCSWTLLEGDFLKMMKDAPAPDCIYYDPFSLNTDSDLWKMPAFLQVFEHCRKRTTRLFTYSASTQVRSALLAAGFYVGKGVGTGPKSETTVALSSVSEGTFGIELLGNDWLTRWKRSDSRVAPGCPTEQRELIESRVQAHPQFRSLPPQKHSACN